MELPKHLRDNYISRKKDEYLKGLEALKKSDFAFFSVLGHQTKGNATSFGFDPLEGIAKRFEVAAKNQDLEALRGLLEEFKNYLDSV